VNILYAILTSLLILISLFLICLVLIQRGKGGGLAGAFGGMGGSSAFGTKAGDIFTRVTMITAVAWILLSMLLVVLYNRGTTSAWDTETTRPGSSRTKEVPPTSTGGTSGKASSSSPAPAPRTSRSTSTPAPASSSSAPLSVPAIPDDAPKPKSK
jgi:preprotein translocase subunit SecG